MRQRPLEAATQMPCIEAYSEFMGLSLSDPEDQKPRVT